MSRFKHTAAVAAFAALAIGAAEPASAEILASASRVGNYTNTSTTGVAIPLYNSGGTTVAFKTTANDTLVRVTYNAECGVVGGAGSWLSVIVKVDNIEIQPASGTNFALCTASGADNYGWVGAVRQSVVKVAKAGTHTLQIIGQGNFGATAWWQGDSSTVVDR